MKKTLNKLLRRNIIDNIKQFLSIIVIVFLATTLFSGFLVNSNTLEKAVNNYFKDTKLADAWLYVDKISQEDEDFFAQNEINYEKRLEFSSTINIKNSPLENESKIFVYDTGKISTPYLVSGTSGCWIDQKVMKNNNLKVGQDSVLFDYDYSIYIDGIEYILNLQFEFLITGTMAISECADVYSSWPILIEKDLFLSKVNTEVNSKFADIMSNITPENISTLPFNQILLKSQNIDETLTKIQQYYSNTSDSRLLLTLKQESIESVVLLKSEVEQSKKMIYIFPTIFLLVSILIIITSINQLILKERTKIGTLKSLGASKKMLLKHYSSYGAFLCVIGAIAGLIIGPLVIPEIMFIKYDILYSIPKDYVNLIYPFDSLLLMFLIVVAIGFFSSFFACREIVGKKPAQCLKPDLIKLKSKQRRKKLELSISIKVAFRNMRIRPIRTTMATIGIMGCVALLLCGFGIGDTLNNSVNNDLQKLFSYDISSGYENADFFEKVENIEEISYFEKYEMYHAGVSNGEILKNINFYVTEEESKITSFVLEQNQAVISKSISDDLKIGIGDFLDINVGGVIKQIKISSIIETAFFNGIYYCGDVEFSEAYARFGIWAKVDGDVTTVVNELNKINGTNNAQSMSDIRQNVENKISSISLMTTTLKVFAIALVIVVLLNFVFLILKERNRDIATLKILGQNIFSITFTITIEILLIGLMGLFLGMLAGYPLLVLVLFVNRVEIMNFLYYISPLSFIFTILIILFAIIMILLIILYQVNKINLIESIKLND